MKTPYQFCALCAAPLVTKENQLRCSRCSFVHYRNPRPTSTAIIVHKGKVLLTKRRRAPYKGWWDLAGGFLERGETFDDALERELGEELGLEIKRKRLLGFYHGTYPSRTDPAFIITAAYIVEPKTSELGIEDVEELSAIQWFSKKDFPEKIAFDSNQKIIKDFIKTWK